MRLPGARQLTLMPSLPNSFARALDRETTAVFVTPYKAIGGPGRYAAIEATKSMLPPCFKNFVLKTKTLYQELVQDQLSPSVFLCETHNVNFVRKHKTKTMLEQSGVDPKSRMWLWADAPSKQPPKNWRTTFWRSDEKDWYLQEILLSC